MFDIVRKINNYFKFATKDDIQFLEEKILFTERQNRIFSMYYIQKQNCNFIADTLCVSVPVITKELKLIREKIIKFV